MPLTPATKLLPLKSVVTVNVIITLGKTNMESFKETANRKDLLNIDFVIFKLTLDYICI